MEEKKTDAVTRIVCAVLFVAFAFCWLHFFQCHLVCAMLQSAFGTLPAILQDHYILISAPLTVIVALLAIPSRLILRFRDGMHACNYMLPALVLGAITGYDGNRFFGQSMVEWIVAGSVCLILYVVCRIVASVPKTSYYTKQRAASGNLLLLSALFCVTAVLGNTQENLHRTLMVRHCSDLGQFEKALSVGIKEEETNRDLSMARLEAMLGLDAQKPGSGIGEYLFAYPVYNHAAMLADLDEMAQCGKYEPNMIAIAKALISRDLSVADTLITPYIDRGSLPRYFMQLMVLTGNQQAAAKHSVQYSEQKAILDSFKTQLEQLSSENLRFQSNSTYIDYHTTYYWFYTFTD